MPTLGGDMVECIAILLGGLRYSDISKNWARAALGDRWNEFIQPKSWKELSSGRKSRLQRHWSSIGVRCPDRGV